MRKNNQAPQKGLSYVQRQQLQRRAEASFHRRFAIQFCMDGVAIGLNEHLGLDGQALVDCLQVIGGEIMKIAGLTTEDAKDDKEIVYTKDQVDKRLQQILPPEAFMPWDERMNEAVGGVQWKLV